MSENKPLTDDMLDDLNKAFEEAEGFEGAQIKAGVFNKIAGLKEGMMSFFSNLYSSPHGQAMWAMSKQVGTEMLYQTAGMALQKAMWATIHKYTGPLAARNKYIHHVFHSQIGMAANTVLLCNIGAFFCFKFAERAAMQGNERQANAYRGAGKALLYSAGAGVVDIFNVPALLDSLLLKLTEVGKEAGVDFEQLGMEGNPAPAGDATSGR